MISQIKRYISGAPGNQGLPPLVVWEGLSLLAELCVQKGQGPRATQFRVRHASPGHNQLTKHRHGRRTTTVAPLDVIF